MDGRRPRPSVGPPGKPVLPELRGSRPVLSPLLYSAQRFRMVSSRCLSCGHKDGYQIRVCEIVKKFHCLVVSNF